MRVTASVSAVLRNGIVSASEEVRRTARSEKNDGVRTCRIAQNSGTVASRPLRTTSKRASKACCGQRQATLEKRRQATLEKRRGEEGKGADAKLSPTGWGFYTLVASLHRRPEAELTYNTLRCHVEGTLSHVSCASRREAERDATWIGCSLGCRSPMSSSPRSSATTFPSSHCTSTVSIT